MFVMYGADAITADSQPVLVVLDMAGTTVADRGEVPAAFSAALADAGVSISPDDLQAVRGSSKRAAVRQLLGEAATDLEVRRVYRAFTTRLFAAYADGGASALPAAADVIATLRTAGIRVALNTGFDRDITSQLIDALGWHELVDAVVCGDDVAHGRPAPDLILEAMARCGVDDARRVATAGDTTLDLRAGHAAGAGWNIGVLSGAHDRARLAGAPHTHLVDSVAGLLDLWRLP
jgi:phosphonatase-like hydrolase